MPSDAAFLDLMQRAGINPGGAAPAQPGEAPDLRRESGIGWPTIAALGALGAGVALARRPGMAAKLSEFWQKPLGGLERWTAAGKPVELGRIGVPGLPSELPLLRSNPQSQLVSDTERIGANMAKGTSRLLEKPFVKSLTAEKPDVIKDLENTQVGNFLAQQATGMTPSQAKQASLANGPQWMRDYDSWRSAMLPVEQWAKRFMGMEHIPQTPGPYIPRKTVRDFEFNLHPQGGMFGDLRTGLGGFEEARQYPTMRAGEAAGVKYDDPRISILGREVYGMRVIETAKYMQRLENRVVFRDKAQAQAVAGGAKVYELEPLPGAPKWYVPFKEEAKFLQDNLVDPQMGRLGFLKHWSDAIARNPNLVNPLPHIVKNMAYKYTLSGGTPGKLLNDVREFHQGTSPMVTLFKSFMPFDETGQTAAEMYRRAVHGIEREYYPSVLRLADMGLEAATGLQRWSSKTIFAKADPAMRFSLFKAYVLPKSRGGITTKGMSGAEAAQNVWIDLIRYGTRSSVVDAWKSMPFNFFVPWRLGTVTTLYKQITDHPFRTAALIGGIDLLREMRYRQTGRWTHLPIDYIEAPIAQVLQAKDGSDAAKSLIATTLATIAFGPGGGMAAATIKDVMEDFQMRGELGRLKNMFWGLSQIFEGISTGPQLLQHLQNGRSDLAARDFGNLLMTAATAEHSAMNYRPRRLLAALPEVGPYLQKSAQVKAAEALQQAAEIRSERGQHRREQRRNMRGTIEDRVKRLSEE